MSVVLLQCKQIDFVSREDCWSYSLASKESGMTADRALCPVDEVPGSDECGSVDSYRLLNDEKLQDHIWRRRSTRPHVPLPTKQPITVMNYANPGQTSQQQQCATTV